MKYDFHQIPGALQCAHSRTVIEQMPPESQHHARLKCTTCGAFLKWLPKPETIERQRLNAFRLAKLQMCTALNSWQREFADDIAKQGGKLSPKQQAVFDRLCLTYLKGGAQ